MPSPAVLAYPTRTGEAQLTYRQEPAVWRDPAGRAKGPLDDDQLALYESDGFLVLPALLGNEQAARLRDAATALSLAEGRSGDERFVFGNGADDLRRIQGLQAEQGPLGAITRNRAIVAAARQILGSRIYVHHARANRAPGTFGEGYPWHSDFERWHAEDGMPRMRAVGASIALSPADEFGGALVMAPGSHRTFISCAGDQPAEAPPGWDARLDPDLYCIDAVLDSCGITRIDVEPGTVVLFDCNTLHATLPNLSPDPVISLFIAYNSVNNALVEPFNGSQPRPGYIASRDFTPVELP